MEKLSVDKMIDVLQKGLDTAKRLGADGAKLSFGRSEHIGCAFENGRLKDTESRRSSFYSIEVLTGRKRGSTTGNNPADMEEMINRAITLARVGSPAHFPAYPEPAECKQVRMHSSRTAAIKREDLIMGCEQMVDSLKRYHPGLYLQAEGNRIVSEGVLVTSGGVCHRMNDTVWSLGAFAQRTENTDMLFAYFSRAWKDLNDFFDPLFIADRIVNDLKNGETVAGAPEGKVPAILPPEILRMFLAPLVMGVNGKNIFKGDSPLQGRLHEQLLDPSFTLIDDPHRDFDTGAAEIDGDGIPTRVITILENGVLKNFLYDLDTAGMAGTNPTGNRGCSPYSLYVSPGMRSSAELLDSINDGIFIRGLIGFGQSNMMNGEISGNVALGYRVKKGKIAGRVKNTMIAGNIYDLFKKNVEFSSDRDPVLRMPSALIEGLRVSAAK